MKEFKEILKGCKEKSTGRESDLMLKVYAIYCCISSNPHLTQNSLWRPTNECLLLSWTTDLRAIPDLSFLQLYQYLVVMTEKYGQDYLKTSSYKKLKAFQFYYEGFIKMMEVAATPYFTFLNCKVKPPMKQICYKVLLKFNNETTDVYAAMCTCPAGTGVNCLGKCNHIGSILFAMEDFNRGV